MSIFKVRDTALSLLRKNREKFDFLIILWEFWQDYRKFIKFAVPEHDLEARLSPKLLEMQTIMDIHSVEKGLSLQRTKHPFGAETIKRLGLEVQRAPHDFFWMGDAMDSLSALNQWNQHGTKSEKLAVPMKRSFKNPKLSGLSLLETRHSVRTFDSSVQVTEEELLEAVRVASFAPSVCNRQSWRVTFAASSKTKEVLLALQNGNSGFTDIPVVGVISVDLSLFSGAGERNQAWVDGGIFAMSLCLALHGAGLGTCLLNTSVRNNYAEKIGRVAGLPDSHQVISMIAIGFPKERYMKARSSRREAKHIANFI